ncbi:MAG: VIT1/CCC1 transporter family protein [Candidatus Omnitrophica bacterium]|nr:VIT1/CCC1 transporter family protein [Candidatus Omnitrophota bacterium]MCM8794158.1 VIT1/CCC1 transporter family protein [Candidatus Omnitrophota bacterium]
MDLNPDLKKKILKFQKNEITEHFVYKKLANLSKDKKNAETLTRISQEEIRHYEFFKSITGEMVSPERSKIIIYVFISRIFGLNFGLKLMEKGEGLAQDGYNGLKGIDFAFEKIIQEENNHEQELIGLIDEESLRYTSSVVLGLNDALVELTGALAGLTLALQNKRLIAIAGLITGISASLSMASSEYLSTQQEETDKIPWKASIYTGITYLGAVILLIFPYFLFKNIFFCLFLVLSSAIFLIFIFNFYTSIAKGLSFKKRFLEMVGISLGISGVNFFVGLWIKRFLGILN